jgi:hypothetical protein
MDFLLSFICDIFAFVELSHDTFTFFTDDILFLVITNYISIFLFHDRILTLGCPINSND